MRKLLLGALASVMTLSAISTGAAEAQGYYQGQQGQQGYYQGRNDHYRHSYRHGYYRNGQRCYNDRRSAGNKGTVLGAVSGGVLGGVIGHGLVGGLVGAGVGAVAGHAIAKGTVHC